MTASTKQALLLAGLVAVLIAVVAYQMRGSDPTIVPASASNPVPGGGSAPAGDGVTDVRLELLASRAAAFRPPQRDPFRFRVSTPAPVARAELPPPPPPPQPVPPARVQESRPPISASIGPIGIYELGGMRVAVLHDGTQNPPIHGVAGDVIEGRFRLLRVDPDAVEMAYLDGGSPQRIPLPVQ